MNTKSTKTLNTVIGIDLGDEKHAVCVTGKDGKILREFTIANTRRHLEELALEYPKARIAMEVGTHSPWISRLLKAEGAEEVVVANARKLRAIYTNDRKCDRLDAQLRSVRPWTANRSSHADHHSTNARSTFLRRQLPTGSNFAIPPFRASRSDRSR